MGSVPLAVRTKLHPRGSCLIDSKTLLTAAACTRIDNERTCIAKLTANILLARRENDDGGAEKHGMKAYSPLYTSEWTSFGRGSS